MKKALRRREKEHKIDKEQAASLSVRSDYSHGSLFHPFRQRAGLLLYHTDTLLARGCARSRNKQQDWKATFFYFRRTNLFMYYLFSTVMEITVIII